MTVKVIICVVSVCILFACTAPKFATGEVDVLEKVMIGGMDQWIMANGHGEDLPVLLWLHGGPGAAQMPVARYFNGTLEELFIVVHWDQRGAGKSNPKDFNENTMTFEQYVSDVHEMTRYLKERFDKDKIYLLGHSWGTQIGLVAAHRYPEDYKAYIGVSQVSHSDSSQILAHRELKRRIDEKRKPQDLQKLERLSGPPYRNHKEYVTFAKMMDSYDMNLDIGMWTFVRVALRSNAYSIGDYRRWLRGANRGSGPMWDELQGFDILELAPSVEVPCFFIMGENDFNTPVEMVNRLTEGLEAPTGIELIVFENAAHTPFFADPERFYETLQRIKKLIE